MKTNEWVIGLLVTALVVPGVWLTLQQGPKSMLASAPPATHRPLTRDTAAGQAAWEKIQPHLDAADAAAKKVVEKHCDRVSDFFAERRQRARAFAEGALSYRSKWAFAKSKFPFSDGDGHRKYLRERFEQIVFSSQEIEEVLQSAVRNCVLELQGLENALLVKVRADLSDDALGAMRDDVRFSTEAALRKEYARAVGNAAKTVTKDLPVWAGREAATWIGADLTAPIIHSLTMSFIGRLGLSGGILGSGAASGAVTLGGGVLAGLVIDAVLDRVLRALGHDPEADIEKQVIDAMEYCEDLVLHGKNFAEKCRVMRSNPDLLNLLAPETNAAPEKPGASAEKDAADDEKGLHYYLLLLNAERTLLRDEALENLVLGGGGR